MDPIHEIHISHDFAIEYELTSPNYDLTLWNDGMMVQGTIGWNWIGFMPMVEVFRLVTQLIYPE